MLWVTGPNQRAGKCWLTASMVILLMPSGLGTEIIWLRDSGTSLNILPLLRMVAFSATPPCHSVTVIYVMPSTPSNSTIQSPIFMGANSNMIIDRE